MNEQDRDRQLAVSVLLSYRILLSTLNSFGFDDLFGKNVKGCVEDPYLNSTGGWGLTLIPRDMARFGFLYLDRDFYMEVFEVHLWFHQLPQCILAIHLAGLLPILNISFATSIASSYKSQLRLPTCLSAQLIPLHYIYPLIASVLYHNRKKYPHFLITCMLHRKLCRLFS